MHEVKVFDPSGKLKKVISVQALKKRENEKAESPHLFRGNKKNPGAQTKDTPAEKKTRSKKH